MLRTAILFAAYPTVLGSDNTNPVCAVAKLLVVIAVATAVISPVIIPASVAVAAVPVTLGIEEYTTAGARFCTTRPEIVLA